MAYSIILDSPGGAESFKYVQTPDKSPEIGEVRIRHTAIGVNYIDIYHRTGLYKTNFPLTPGVEAVGIIEEIGTGVEGFDIGDRVAYGTNTGLQGAYSTHRTIPVSNLVKLPNDILDEIAASLMVKGLTAFYLLRRTFSVKQGNNILIHAAAGGVGTIMCQWAKSLGANVIGTVSSEEKAKWAVANGCLHPIIYTKEDFVARTRAITLGQGVQVVYDSVGKDTFQKSLDCLAPFGLLASYGQASGAIPPFDLSALAANSLFVTRPVLGVYMRERMDMILSANEVFEMIRQKVIKPHITKKIPLKDAAEAHKLLETRRTVGSIILVP